VTVAHAYGNRWPRIAAATSAGVDFIETDLHFYRGRVFVRHERRLGRLPLLYNRALHGIHREGPYALSLGSLWLRLEPRPLPFEAVVKAIAGKSGLMLDLKAAGYSAREAERFIAAIFVTLEHAGFAGALDFCGSWKLLDEVRRQRPGQAVHFSVDNDRDWEAALWRMASVDTFPAITLKRSLVDGTRTDALREARVPFYCWDVLDEADARHALAHGASGIIADDLALLRELRDGH
jgi:glycerophosphoryl diester phosphodiesterase